MLICLDRMHRFRTNGREKARFAFKITVKRVYMWDQMLLVLLTEMVWVLSAHFLFAKTFTAVTYNCWL